MTFLRGTRKLMLAAMISTGIPFLANGQSTSGIPGYMRIPTATFNKDGTLYFGSSFLPKQHLEYTNYNYNAATAFASITFLPFVELDFRFTRQLNLPSYSDHVSDRMPSVRIRLFKEKKWIPSVVFGVHDFITSLESGSARHFESSYLVISKGFHIKPAELNLEGTLGYGTSWLVAQNHELLGFFGGFSLNWQRVKWMSLMADYDGRVFSTGLEAICFNHLFIKAGVVNFDSFTGCISYHFYLKH